MVDQLLKYVEEQLAKGYKPEVIKSALIRQGYSPALVDGVIESVARQGPSLSAGPTGVSHEKTALPKIFLVIAFLAIVVLGAVFLPGLFKPKQPLLDVRATPDKLVYAPGEKMGFSLEIINMGSEEKFDIGLVYRILDKSDNLILNQERSLAISTSASQYIAFDLPPKIKPGDYNLKVFANYGEGKVATSSFSFGIEESPAPPVQPSCKDKIRNQDELGPDCSGVCGGYWYDGSCHTIPQTVPPEGENCNDEKQNQDETGIDCGGVCGGYWYDSSCHSAPKPTTPPTIQPSFAKQMMDISQLAKSNPEGAKNKCLEFTKTEEKDMCLKTVAHEGDKSEYCDLMTDSMERDNCYIPFFMSGDYSLCEKITDEQSRKSCKTLREIEMIKQAMNQTG